jgi:hypothetical protein
MSVFKDEKTKKALKRSGVSEKDAISLITNLILVDGAFKNLSENIDKSDNLFRTYVKCVKISKHLYENIDIFIWDRLLSIPNKIVYKTGNYYRVDTKERFIMKMDGLIFIISIKNLILKYINKWHHEISDGEFSFKIRDKNGLSIPTFNMTHEIKIELNKFEEFIRFVLVKKDIL